MHTSLYGMSIEQRVLATKHNVVYLQHQLSDGADILQFRSTSEYFETVKYELQTLFHVRVTA